MNHVATRKVDLQRFGCQFNRARFYGRRGQVNYKTLPSTALKGEFVMERQAVIVDRVAARFGASPVLVGAGLRNKIQSRPSSFGQEQDTGQRNLLVMANVGINPPCSFDDQ